MPRLLLEVDEAKVAMANVQRMIATRRKELEAEQDALRKARETLDKSSSKMTPAVRKQKQDELDQRVVMFSEKTARSKAEMADLERVHMAPIMSRVLQSIAVVAKRDGINWVAEKAGVIYADLAFDLTNEVIREHNATFKR